MILFIIIQKDKLILDQYSYSDMLCGYGPWFQHERQGLNTHEFSCQHI